MPHADPALNPPDALHPLPSDDPVNHPAHYTRHPSGVECIDIIEHMPYNVGAAIKYLWRAGLKLPDELIQDTDKARWHIEREVARLKKLAGKDVPG